MSTWLLRLAHWFDPAVDDETDEEPDPTIVAEGLIESGMPQRLAEAVGQFRSELDSHDSVSSSEAKRYTRDYLEHLLNTWSPLPE